MTIQANYQRTKLACYLGLVTQAISANFAPLLFLTFYRTYGISYADLALIPLAFFLTQLLVDFLSAKFVDRIGYRKSIVMAQITSGAGLLMLSFVPDLCPNPFAGILICVIVYAIGSGLIEVLCSPIIEACPFENKARMMSLLHSFYCWGQVLTVAVSTAFFAIFGVSAWPTLACLWAVIPLGNALLFLRVPLYPVVPAGTEPLQPRRLFTSGTFWLLMLLMLCAGASEQAMSQWASAFAESALGVTKTVGDIAGPCMFAVLMGTARALYGKFSAVIPLKKAMAGCAALCVCAYLLAALSCNPVAGLAGCALCGFSVGIFWPGTFSTAAAELPAYGTSMYALMALAGDVGCSGGPTLVGFAADAADGSLKPGLLAAIVFPLLILAGTGLLKGNRSHKKP